MTLYYIFLLLANAQSAEAKVDARQGYPKPGVEVGAGVHVRDVGGGAFVTRTYAVPLQHPTLSQWAFPADGVTTVVLSAPDAALGFALPDAGALAASWDGSTAIVPDAGVTIDATLSIEGGSVHLGL